MKWTAFKKRWLTGTILIVSVIIIWNLPLTYRIGVNNKIFEKRIPLYAKACGFLYRDWMYKDIVNDIVGEEKDDLKKVLAIFRWVNGNVRYGVPPGFKMVDDHHLNIIIRQYGAKDQIEDIFTMLCSYAGMKAARKKCYNRQGNKNMILSFVYVNDRWLIFDAAQNKYFYNKDGNIGSIEDYFSGNLVMSSEESAYYGEFLDDSRDIPFKSFVRVEEQMPFKRLQVQIKKIFMGKNVSLRTYRK